MIRLSRLLLLLFQMGIFASLLNAQNVTASITGTVTDSTGAAIPNAKVVATNTGTGVPYGHYQRGGRLQPAVSPRRKL